MLRVTESLLDHLDACGEAQEKLVRHWPKGIPVRVPSAVKALRVQLDIPWLLCAIVDELEYELDLKAGEEDSELAVAVRADYDAYWARRRPISEEFLVWRRETQLLTWSDDPRAVARREQYWRDIAPLAVEFLQRWLPVYYSFFPKLRGGTTP